MTGAGGGVPPANRKQGVDEWTRRSPGPQAEKAIRFLAREGGIRFEDAELVFTSLPVTKQVVIATGLERIERALESANQKVSRGRRGLPM